MKKTLAVLLVLVIILSLVIFTIYLSFKKADMIEDSKNYNTDKKIPLEEYELNENEIIGYLSIPKLDLKDVEIKDGENNFSNSIGHFTSTGYLSGNIALIAHNSGFEYNYFEYLYTLNKGDEVIYTNQYFTKTYIVEDLKEISEDDISVLNESEENILTLITCITEKPTMRLCVIAKEIEI